MVECTEKQLQQALKLYYKMFDKKKPIDSSVLDDIIVRVKKGELSDS